MTTTSIRPESATVIFLDGSLLEHELPSRVKYPNGKRSVEESELMRPHFFFLSDRTVVFIDEENIVIHIAMQR